jgi:hypothetical protein
MLRALTLALALSGLAGCSSGLPSTEGTWFFHYDRSQENLMPRSWGHTVAPVALEGTILCGKVEPRDVTMASETFDACYDVQHPGISELSAESESRCLRFGDPGTFELRIEPVACAAPPSALVDGDLWSFDVYALDELDARPMTFLRSIAWSREHDTDLGEAVIDPTLRLVAGSPVELDMALVHPDAQGPVAWNVAEASLRFEDAVGVTLGDPDEFDVPAVEVASGGHADVYFDRPSGALEAGDLVAVDEDSLTEIVLGGPLIPYGGAPYVGAAARDGDGNLVWGGTWTWRQLSGTEVKLVPLSDAPQHSGAVAVYDGCIAPSTEDELREVEIEARIGSLTATATRSWLVPAASVDDIEGFEADFGCENYVEPPADEPWPNLPEAPDLTVVPACDGCSEPSGAWLFLPLLGFGRRRFRRPDAS